jgi:hypothetical protein
LPKNEYLYMSDHQKPQPEARKRHMEKQIMDQPQEEFVGDEARPSKDVSEVKPKVEPKERLWEETTGQ